MTILPKPRVGSHDNGGIYLINRCIGLLILPLLVLSAGLAMAQNETNTTADATNVGEANIANDTTPLNEPGEEAVTKPTEESAPATANLNYVWSVTGIESDLVTMVLNQTGSSLSGQAKYEASNEKPWNALVMGSVTGNVVDLVMTAQKSTGMVMTKMTGNFSGDTITGTFIQTDSSGKSKNGDFTATWINPDTSTYTPAKIEEAKAETPAPADSSLTTGSSATETTTEEAADTSAKATKYVDVRKYKDQIGPGGDLSGVPPGMSGFV
jgi:hypothetical protein